MIIDEPMKSEVIVGEWFIIACLDGYEPRLAQIVIDTINEQSEETVTMLFNFASDGAREGMTWN